MKILVVEDHEDTLRVMSRLLTMEGHDIDTATTLSGGRLRLDSHVYDLLIADIGLPDGPGYALMNAATQRRIPGIAISGYGMSDDITASRAAGFSVHLTKPVNLQTLLQAVEQAKKSTG